MSEQPLDLRSLGDIDSPEVVRVALKRFRRRALRSVAWLLLGAAAIASFVVADATQRTLGERIEAAPGTTAGAVYRVEGMTATLEQIADLGQVTGFHLIVAVPGTGPQTNTGQSLYEVEVPRATDVLLERSRSIRLFHLWFSLRVPSDGRISLPVKLDCSPLAFANPDGERACAVLRGPEIERLVGTIDIDLNELGIPASIWR